MDTGRLGVKGTREHENKDNRKQTNKRKYNRNIMAKICGKKEH